MVRLLLVGRAPIVSEMLERKKSAFEIVGDVSAPTEISRAESADVVVVSSAATARQLLESWDDEQWPALVVVSRERRLAAELAASGAPGWAIVSPDATSDDLAAAIVAASRGFGVQQASAAARFLRTDEESIEGEHLTARERDVLELVSQGLGNKAIARRLQIGEHTVKFHLSSIFSKFGVSSRTEAVRRGVRAGLITL